MTVAVCIRCTDGVVVACDSLTTFGRGVPVQKHSNKSHVLRHSQLASPMVISAAGMTTYFDKFVDMAKRTSIQEAADHLDRPLDVVDFAEYVCETGVLSLYKRYVYDRARFLDSSPVTEMFSLSLIVAGATREGDLRAYFVYQDGLTEQIDTYGTIGSGAAYAELFLRFLLRDTTVTTTEAEQLAVHAIKGVELMDPHVGGPVNVETLTLTEENGVECKPSRAETDTGMENVRQRMDGLLRKLGKDISGSIKGKTVDLVEGNGKDDVGRAVEEVTDGARQAHRRG